MSKTADMYYTCPKCGAARSALMSRSISDAFFGEYIVRERACLNCWHRWIPGGEPKNDPFAWRQARGIDMKGE